MDGFDLGQQRATQGAHPAILVEYSTSSSSGPGPRCPTTPAPCPTPTAPPPPWPAWASSAARRPRASPAPSTSRPPRPLTSRSGSAPSRSTCRARPSGPWFWDDNFFGSDGGTALDTRADGFDLTWLNGNDSLDGETTNTITLKGGDCQPPAEPSAELANECATKNGATGITILLENTGGTSATFNVAGVGNVVVAAHDDTTVFVPVAEDAAYSVAVTVGGDPVPGSPIAGTRDCLSPNPSAELADECATNQAGAPGISILLENTGTQGVTFDVEGVGSVAVGAGAQTTVFVAVAEDAAYSIDVKVGGQHVPGSPIAGTRDCLTAEPSAELADECAVSDDVEGITITLANTGTQGVTFNVEGLGDVVVGPNDSETVFVAVDENSSYSIDVIALGAHVPGSPINGTRATAARPSRRPASTTSAPPCVAPRASPSRSPTTAMTTRPSRSTAAATWWWRPARAPRCSCRSTRTAPTPSR